jgi:hypothetical protein
VRGQRREIWPWWVLAPSRCSEHCRAVILVPLLLWLLIGMVMAMLKLIMLLMHAGCIVVGQGTSSRRFRARPDVRVKTLGAKRLAEAAAVVLWRMWLLIRRLVRAVRRGLLVDGLHVAFVAHHAQMGTLTRRNIRGISKLVLELLWGLVYSRRPLRLRLLLTKRRERIRGLFVRRCYAWTL